MRRYHRLLAFLCPQGRRLGMLWIYHRFLAVLCLQGRRLGMLWVLLIATLLVDKHVDDRYVGLV
jgi:hypothetical protein